MTNDINKEIENHCKLLSLFEIDPKGLSAARLQFFDRGFTSVNHLRNFKKTFAHSSAEWAEYERVELEGAVEGFFDWRLGGAPVRSPSKFSRFQSDLLESLRIECERTYGSGQSIRDSGEHWKFALTDVERRMLRDEHENPTRWMTQRKKLRGRMTEDLMDQSLATYEEHYHVVDEEIALTQIEHLFKSWLKGLDPQLKFRKTIGRTETKLTCIAKMESVDAPLVLELKLRLSNPMVKPVWEWGAIRPLIFFKENQSTNTFLKTVDYGRLWYDLIKSYSTFYDVSSLLRCLEAYLTFIQLTGIFPRNQVSKAS